MASEGEHRPSGPARRWFGLEPSTSLAAAADRAGLPLRVVTRVWAALGFPAVDDPTAPTLDDREVAAIDALAVAVSQFGEDAAVQFSRVIGAGLARIADAAIPMFELNVEPGLDATAASAPERQRASAYALAALAAVPRLVLEPLFPRHVVSAIDRGTLYRAAGQYGTRDLAVGFADLVGYTSMTAAVPAAELSAAVDDLVEAAASRLSATGDASIVKLIGDEVMFVAGDPVEACAAALDLCAHVHAHPVLGELRAGIGHGRLVARDGDYFGAEVNLAARARALAPPGGVLITPSAREALVAAGDDRLQVTSTGAHALRGVPEPVELFAVTYG